MRPPSMWQILIIVLIVVILFGAKRLPDVASSIGKSLKIFKKEVTELREDDGGAPGHDAGTTGQQPYGTTGQQGTTPPPPGAPPPGYGTTPPPSAPAPGSTPNGGTGTDQR